MLRYALKDNMLYISFIKLHVTIRHKIYRQTNASAQCYVRCQSTKFTYKLVTTF